MVLVTRWTSNIVISWKQKARDVMEDTMPTIESGIPMAVSMLDRYASAIRIVTKYSKVHSILYANPDFLYSFES